MEFKTFVFYLLATVMVFAAVRVVTVRNPVQAALFLVLTFFNAAGIWLLLQAEFLAITLQQARRQRDFVLAGNIHQPANARSLGHRFGQLF